MRVGEDAKVWLRIIGIECDARTWTILVKLEGECGLEAIGRIVADVD